MELYCYTVSISARPVNAVVTEKKPPKNRQKWNQVRLHYLAMRHKNKKFLILTTPALTFFTPSKNPRFSNETRKFVQRVEGVLFFSLQKVRAVSRTTMVVQGCIAGGVYWQLKPKKKRTGPKDSGTVNKTGIDSLSYPRRRVSR